MRRAARVGAVETETRALAAAHARRRGALRDLHARGDAPAHGEARGPAGRLGLVRGPGGARKDRVLARLSPGEFVVNAASAARHRAVLEVINRGDERLRRDHRVYVATHEFAYAVDALNARLDVVDRGEKRAAATARGLEALLRREAGRDKALQCLSAAIEMRAGAPRLAGVECGSGGPRENRVLARKIRSWGGGCSLTR